MKVRGWVEDIRNLGKIKFIILHTSKEDIQITCKKDKMENFEILKEISLQSAIEVEGEVVESSISKLGKEIIAKRVEIISKAPSILPIDPSGKVEYLELSKLFLLSLQ
jgi:aspartyl-tRNA synthetase